MLTDVNDITFEAEVLRAPGAVLVEFYTPSCGSCRQLEPHLRQLAQGLSGALKVVKVNSFSSPGIAGHYGVKMAPTLIVFKNGQAMSAIQGAPPPHRLHSMVQPFL